MGGVSVIEELKNLKIGGKRVPYNNGIENFEGFSREERDSERAQLYFEVEKELFREINYCKNIRRAKSGRCYKKLAATVIKHTDYMYGLTRGGDLNEIKKQYNKTIKKFKRMEEKEIMAGKGIIKEATECVNSVIEASGVLAEFYGEKQAFVANLNQSTEIANQIIEVLNGCVDDSSKQAAQLAEEVMKQVYIWRNHASLYTCQSGDIRALQNALKSAKELQKLPVNVNRLKEARDADIVKYDPEGVPQKILNDNPNLDIGSTDAILMILDAPQAFEKLTDLRDAMNDYVYRGNYQRKQNLEIKIAEKKELIEKYTAEQNEIYAQYKNGKLSKVAANERIGGLDTKINALKREVYGSTRIIERADGTQQKQATYGLSGDLDTINKSVESRSRFIESMNSKIEDIEGYKDDLFYFSKFMNGIDFDSALKIFRGRDVTREQISEVIENLQEVFIQRKSELLNEGIAYKYEEESTQTIVDTFGNELENTNVTEEIINEPKVKEIINDGFGEEVGNFSALDRFENRNSDADNSVQDDDLRNDDLDKISLGEDDR